MNIVGALSQIGSVRLYLTNAGSKARPVKVLVHGDAIGLGSGKLRTVVTTASHLELMCSCVLGVGIERVCRSHLQCLLLSLSLTFEIQCQDPSAPISRGVRLDYHDSFHHDEVTILISILLVIVMPRLVDEVASEPRVKKANQDYIDLLKR
jgi:hypothetical protein